VGPTTIMTVPARPPTERVRLRLAAGAAAVNRGASRAAPVVASDEALVGDTTPSWRSGPGVGSGGGATVVVVVGAAVVTVVVGAELGAVVGAGAAGAAATTRTTPVIQG
jgi:hypothetical protein